MEISNEYVSDPGASLRARFPMLNDNELSLLLRQFEESEYTIRPYDANEDRRVLSLNYKQGKIKTN